MRIICAEFYEIISIIITTHGRIGHWNETLRYREKSNLRQRARSSPSHKSGAFIISIVERHNFGAAVGPRDNSSRINRRLMVSKGLRLPQYKPGSKLSTIQSHVRIKIGQGANKDSCLQTKDGVFATDTMFTHRLCEEAKLLELNTIEVALTMTVDDLARRVTESFGL